MSFICVRYADLTNVDNDFMKNYLLPSNHFIIPLVLKLKGISGWACEDDEISLHDFFRNPENDMYLSTRSLYDLCRDPNVIDLIEIYYYS